MMRESKIQLNERKIRNGARRGAIKENRTMGYKTWKKLKTVKPRKVKFILPPHISFSSTDTGMVYYGTNKPFVRDDYDEVYIDEWVK